MQEIIAAWCIGIVLCLAALCGCQSSGKITGYSAVDVQKINGGIVRENNN
jgi:hypothetical protein